MAAASSEALPLRAGRARTAFRRRSLFYLALSLLLTLIVAVGFWPSYFGPLVRGIATRPWIIHFHGIVYVGWMALLIVQATLAARGRVKLHRSLGTIGIGYGVLVWIVGLVVSFAAPAMHVRAGDWPIDQAAAFLPIPLGDMVLFGGFFAAAVAYRRKPEIHKRFILLATLALVFAAAFRMRAYGFSMPTQLAVWFMPLLVAVGYDVVKARRVHPVYWIGAAVMVVGLFRIPFGESAFWLPIGRRIFEALT